MMLTRLAVLVLGLARPAAAQVVVTDPTQTTLTKLQMAVQEKHNQFMKMQMVQDAVTLKNNYLASKAFYEMVEQNSKHRGGLMGYYKDMVEQQFDNIAQQQYRQFNDEFTNVTGENAVNTALNRMSKKVSDTAGAGIDAGANASMRPFQAADGTYAAVRGQMFQREQKQVEALEARTMASDKIVEPIEKEIKNLVRRASVPTIGTKEKESIDLHAQLTQLQLLAEIRQMLSINSQALNAQARKNLNEQTMALSAVRDLAKYKADASAFRKPSDNDVVKELKRRPGE